MKPTIAYLLMAATAAAGSTRHFDSPIIGNGRGGIEAKIAKRTPKGKRRGKK